MATRCLIAIYAMQQKETAWSIDLILYNYLSVIYGDLHNLFNSLN